MNEKSKLSLGSVLICLLTACGDSYNLTREDILSQSRHAEVVEIEGTESDGPFRGNGTEIGHTGMPLIYKNELPSGWVNVERAGVEGAHYEVESYLTREEEILLVFTLSKPNSEQDGTGQPMQPARKSENHIDH